MKQHRNRFKTRKKNIKLFNAQFDKVSAGVAPYRHALVNINKSRQPKEILSGKRPKK